jgi:hypothetical protein
MAGKRVRNIGVVVLGNQIYRNAFYKLRNSAFKKFDDEIITVKTHHSIVVGQATFLVATYLNDRIPEYAGNPSGIPFLQSASLRVYLYRQKRKKLKA